MTWLDSVFEFDTKTEGGPGITITVGFEVPARWHAHRSYAAEMTMDGQFRAITHIPEVNIIKEEKLHA